MTTTRQHIEDLDADRWAALTRRAAAESVAAAERLGIQPRAETVALANMTEHELVQHRQRNGPPVPRRSLPMQLVDADHQRRVAEEHARQAYQGRLDAEAAASLAREEATESARMAAAARERVRAVEAEAARKDAERAAEREAEQRARQQLQAEIERIRAQAAADVAAAEEKVRAAEARAAERTTERTTERAAAEKAVQQLQAEIEQIRAQTAAEVAAAEEKVKAADSRAAERTTERTAERATGEETVQRVRRELEKVRSDSADEVAAAQGKASADIAAAREAAAAEIAAAREAADAEVARWQAHASDMERWARAEVSTQLLTIPVPPMEVRTRIGSVETTIDALYQIDYVLEVGLAEDGESHFVPDLEFTRNLVWKVQEQAKELSRELANLSAWYSDQSHSETAAGYPAAAHDAYRALCQRIDTALQALGRRFHSPDADIIAAVTAMLTDLRAQGLY
jgi:DNA repair exonuclease SbcCD ATPase subunit